MAEILLVHGSAHGAWCWRDLIPLLNADGHVVTAIDLPGAGGSPADINALTLQDYTDAILAAMSANSKTILLGHSAAGYPISTAAIQRPDLVAHLIYLCAYTPSTGQSMIDRRKAAPRQLVAGAVQKSQDGQSYHVKPDQARAVFYGDCSDEQVAFALQHLSAQPIAPQDTPITVTQTLRDLPKSYIRCSRDGSVPAEFQISMMQEWPEMTRYDLDSDHSPFFSQPEKLANIVNQIAQN